MAGDMYFVLWHCLEWRHAVLRRFYLHAIIRAIGV